MIAHIRISDKKEQTLKEHLETVSTLCKNFAQSLNLSAMAELIGLLHDMGKGTADFKIYLRNAVCDEKETVHTHHHAPTGAIYAYERWFQGGSILQQRVTQIISLCIYGHHTGLMDCIDKDNDLWFQKCMNQDKDKIRYREAVEYFLKNIRDEEYLDQLFMTACAEFEQKMDALSLKNDFVEKRERTSRRDFQIGMLARLMLSMLIDADRWDSACFEYDNDPLKAPPKPDWKRLSDRYEIYAEKTFTGTGDLDRKRQEISDTCAEKAKGKPGIYRLSVPTGGGKTFASLRYALKHAKENRQQRIFYIIPFNTILDQNARDIREALDHYEGILEHHSNVLMDKDKNTEEYRLHYKQLTERWDSDIILTSMVQFLNALFRRENTNARRMHRLTNAVLIFDEIQALPRNCKGLFERVITFLTTCCHSTILLCTATQMELNLPVQPVELMGTNEDLTALNHALKRVEYIPQIERTRTNTEAAEGLFHLLSEKPSALMIVNTKAAAWDIFEKTRSLLQEAGCEMVEIESCLTDEEIQKRARNSECFEILCVHLSTLLCPAHRKEYIKWIQNWTKAGGRMLCVSTALIEAGINVSFPIVVRSLASLPSIIQAAGRCNRNMEQTLGTVYIWELQDENLGKLEEIAQGKALSKEIISDWRNYYESYDSMSDPEGIRLYFTKEHAYTKKNELYPRKKTKGTIVDLLSDNQQRVQGRRIPYKLRQAFATAGEEFQVISDVTTPILVPYEEGEDIIQRLYSSHTMGEEIQLLRQAQQYCVNLYDNMYRRLAGEKALDRIGENDIVILKKEYYSAESGVTAQAGELEEIIF